MSHRLCLYRLGYILVQRRSQLAHFPHYGLIICLDLVLLDGVLQVILVLACAKQRTLFLLECRKPLRCLRPSQDLVSLRILLVAEFTRASAP
jgi:hypothetical protein